MAVKPPKLPDPAKLIKACKADLKAKDAGIGVDTLYECALTKADASWVRAASRGSPAAKWRRKLFLTAMNVGKQNRFYKDTLPMWNRTRKA